MLMMALAWPSMVRAQYLVLTQSDGTTAEFSLGAQPVITFSDGELTVTCGDKQITTSLEGTTYKFANSATAIEQVYKSSEPEAEVKFGQAAFTGLNKGEQVGVYTLGGIMVSTTTADADGRATADLTTLPKGVYIIKARGKSIKIRN